MNYDPLNGYDADAHISYVDYLAMYLPDKIKVPDSLSTYEYFSPPIPYLFPAGFSVICRNIIEAQDLVIACRPHYLFFAKIFQALMYLSTLIMYSKISKLLYPNSNTHRFFTLIMISILTVNYKTFAMIRGEPYILFFYSVILFLILSFMKKDNKNWIKSSLILGIFIGLTALSRQWGFLLFPSIILLTFFLDSTQKKKDYFKYISSAFVVGFIISGWFYFNLFFNYGSFTQFNMEPSTFSFSNQPSTFYSPFDIDNENVFKKPIRPYFSNQYLPVLYSDLWGDYWGYFTFTRQGWDYGRNQEVIGDYLARVNRVSLLPTSLLILGFSFAVPALFKKERNNIDYYSIILILASLVTYIGYLWFLIKYPEIPKGGTIKAAYIIQFFHVLALLSANFLEHLREKYLVISNIVIVLLLIVFVHNIPAMITNYI
tara:strand:+ start:773 stop:2062 length:1290 start_codon:yes stop_codon:yes gene_type:complete